MRKANKAKILEDIAAQIYNESHKKTKNLFIIEK